MIKGPGAQKQRIATAIFVNRTRGSKGEPKVKPEAELLGVGAGIGIKNLESTKIFCRPNLLKGSIF